MAGFPAGTVPVMAMDAFDVEGYCPPFRIYQFANPRIDASMNPKYPSIHQFIDPSNHVACEKNRGTFQRWTVTTQLSTCLGPCRNAFQSWTVSSQLSTYLGPCFRLKCPCRG